MGGSAGARLFHDSFLKKRSGDSPDGDGLVFKRLSQFDDVEGGEPAGELVTATGVYVKRIYIAADGGISFLQPLTATMAARATSTPPSTSTT